MLPFCHFQCQRCIKILCPEDPDLVRKHSPRRCRWRALRAICEALSSMISPWRARRAVSPLPTQKSNFLFFGYLWHRKCHSEGSRQNTSPFNILVLPDNTLIPWKNPKIVWAVGLRIFFYGENFYVRHKLPLFRFSVFRTEFWEKSRPGMGFSCMIDTKIDRSIGSKISTTNCKSKTLSEGDI